MTGHVRRSSDAAYSFGQRLTLWAAPPLTAAVLQTLSRTGKLDVRDEHCLTDTLDTHGHALVAFWHETIVLAAWYFRDGGHATLTSRSFDGELAARVLGWYGFFVARGSSSRGGYDALVQLMGAIDQAPCIGFTLDGPRGPRRVAKPGIAILAARTGIPIVPAAFQAEPAWRLRSWDRLAIPRPFSRIICRFGAPIYPKQQRTPENIEETRLNVEAQLNALHEQLEQNANGS